MYTTLERLFFLFFFINLNKNKSNTNLILHLAGNASVIKSQKKNFNIEKIKFKYQKI